MYEWGLWGTDVQLLARYLDDSDYWLAKCVDADGNVYGAVYYGPFLGVLLLFTTFDVEGLGPFPYETDVYPDN